jgi:1,4-alpha-glucan branching enzyme
MSYTHKEPLQPKLTAMPASKDVEALVRAEHHDPFSILGPHDDEQGGQFIRAFLPEALSVNIANNAFIHKITEYTENNQR